jgi:hypothetical protein
MLRSSIRTKILSIAVGFILLMIVTAGLSLVAALQVGNRLEQLSESYFPAYDDLAHATIDSLGRALEIRRMIIAKTGTPPDPIRYAESQTVAETKLKDIDQEERAARALIQTMIENTDFSERSRSRALKLSLTRYLLMIGVISPMKPSACYPFSTPGTRRRSPRGSNASRICAMSLPER